MKVFLAVWKHKHGEDLSLHRSVETARAQLAEWGREALYDWLWAGNDEEAERLKRHYDGFSDKTLVARWSNITGDNEFMTVEELDLQD